MTHGRLRTHNSIPGVVRGCGIHRATVVPISESVRNFCRPGCSKRSGRPFRGKPDPDIDLAHEMS